MKNLFYLFTFYSSIVFAQTAKDFLINDNDKFIGHNFSGKYLDCGTMKGYINSTLEISKI